MNTTSGVSNSTLRQTYTTFCLNRIATAILLTLTFAPNALANCLPDGSGLYFTCSGSASDNVFLDTQGNPGSVAVTVKSDFTSSDSLYISNGWDWSGTPGSSEPSIDYSNTLSSGLSVLLEPGSKLTQVLSPNNDPFRRVLYIEAATDKLSVVLERDVEQTLNVSSASNHWGYLHAIEIRNMQGAGGAIFDLYDATENSIAMSGNIEQSINIAGSYLVTSQETISGHGGFVGFNAEIAGIKNHISLSGDISQSVTAEAFDGSQSGSPGDIAAIRIFSNTWQNEANNYSASFVPLATLEKAENYIDIFGNIKQNFTATNMFAYVQSGSNFINDALYVNMAGVNNTVLMSGDVERTLAADSIHEMVGSGVNIQSNLYDGLNTGGFSQTVTPDPALFLNDITNHIEISGNIKQTVVSDAIEADTSASSGRQGFSTASVQVMGSHNNITISGDVTKDIQASDAVHMSGDAAILVQANATSPGLGYYSAGLAPEIWDMVGRTENTINLSGNVAHRISGGQQHSSMLYQNINFGSVDVSALGIKNIATVSGDIERTFSGDSGVLGSSALAIKLNLLQSMGSGGYSYLYAPSEETLTKTQNSIHLSGHVKQDISYAYGVSNRFSGYESFSELFASDIAAAGRQSDVLISGNTYSTVSLPPAISSSDEIHAGGIRLRNYYGDMNALMTGNITVADANDVAGSLLDTVPPSLCLTAMFDDSGCPGGSYDIKHTSVGLRATNYGDSLTLAVEGDILSPGIGIQVRPFAETHTVTREDGSTLLKGRGDVKVDIAARVQGLGGYAFEASRITEDKLTLGLRDNWVLEGAAYAAYSNPDNRLMLHGDTDSSLDLSRLSSVGEWAWMDSTGNFTGYELSGDTIANFHHLEKEGHSAWYLTGTQTDGGFRDGIIRSGALILDNASLLMEKKSQDSMGNIDPTMTHSGLLTVASHGVIGTLGTSSIRGGDVSNAGLINLNTQSSASNHLTVEGNFHSDGGTIALGTVLGDDNSATDNLTITGNSSGSGKVAVTNVGGHGAATVQGIELINIQGNSDATFTKASRIVAGAYDYDLVKKGRNWYLANTPGSSIRPEVGAYQANHMATNALFLMRLHDRGGERQRKDPITGEEMKGMWARQEFGEMRFGNSRVGLSSDTNRYVTQIGIDLIECSSNERNHLTGGLMAGYGHTSSKTRAKSTGYSSRGNTDGWSAGIYGTWFEDGESKEGAYADSWLLYSRFKNTISGDELALEKYWTDSVTASLELGYSFKLSQTEYSQQHRRSAYIQPQAQVVQTWGNNINHKEYNGTQINSEGDNTLFRLGVRVFSKERWMGSNGHFREFEPYGELNWQTSNTINVVKANEVSLKNNGMKNVLEMRVGIRGQLTDSLALWTDVSMKSGQQEYRDRMGQIGLKYQF